VDGWQAVAYAGSAVTVGMIIGLVASARRPEQILGLVSLLEAEDVTQALRYAAWRAEEMNCAGLPMTLRLLVT